MRAKPGLLRVLAISLFMIGWTAQRSHAACELMPNGTFDKFTANWTVTPSESQTGAGFTFQDFTLANGTGLLYPMDSNTLLLQAVTDAIGPAEEGGEPAASSVQLILTSDPAPITHRYFNFTRGGGFELQRMGQATSGFELVVNIYNAQVPSSKPVVSRTLNSLNPVPFATCDFGFAVLGIFADQPPIVMDLLEHEGQPTGLSIGDDVRVELVLNCSAQAATPCEEGVMSAALYLDNFQFCPYPSGPLVGDINADGFVDVLDLLALISAWGVCFDFADCPADLDATGDVNVLDLLLLIENWSG